MPFSIPAALPAASPALLLEAPAFSFYPEFSLLFINGSAASSASFVSSYGSVAFAYELTMQRK